MDMNATLTLAHVAIAHLDDIEDAGARADVLDLIAETLQPLPDPRAVRLCDHCRTTAGFIRSAQLQQMELRSYALTQLK